MGHMIFRIIRINGGITMAVGMVSPAVTEAGGAAADLEFGTKPHMITPKARKALRFGGAPLTHKGNCDVRRTEPWPA